MPVRVKSKGCPAAVRSILMLLLAAALAGPAAAPAHAQTATDARLELVRFNLAQSDPTTTSDQMQFQSELTYQLQAADVFLLVFVFEDDTQTSSQDLSDGLRVPQGSGTIKLNVNYQPREGVQAVSLFYGLFRQDKSLVTWVATNPIPLAPWAGRRAFQAAMAARSAGDFTAAVAHLDRALEVEPESESYLYWRADSLVNLQRYDDAILDYTRALRLAPQDRAARVGRGVALVWKTNWQGAIADLSAVIDDTSAHDGWTAWAHRARGLAYAGQSRNKNAIADYQAYLSLEPNAPDRAEVESWIDELR